MSMRVCRHSLGGAAVLLLGCLGVGCSDSESTVGERDATAQLRPTASTQGLLQVESERSAVDAAAALRQALDDAGLAVPLDLDHQANALAAGLELPASRVVAFGNPALGTPLMQENVLAALDLPLRMLVSARGDGSATITYDGPSYLRQRHALGGVDSQLEQAEGALARFAGAAAARMIEPAAGDASGIDAAEGVVIVESTRGAEATLAALLGAIEGNPALSVVTQVDHQAAAVSAGLGLGFATVVMFGSAAVGTPLMQDSPSIGLDLPLKILVAERDGSVVLAYGAPAFLAERHGDLEGQAQRLQMMATALDALSAAAAGT